MARSESKAVDALVRDIQFRDIRLIETRAKQSIRLGTLPTNTQISAMLQAQRIERDDERLARFLPILILESRYEDDSAKDGISIMARYQITYSANSLKHATDDALTDFGTKEVMPMIWPYWQALVADMLAKMCLPFLRIEPFRQATLTRGEPPAELQALGVPATAKPIRKRAPPLKKTKNQ